MAFLHNIKIYDMENTSTNGASVSLWFNGCPHRCTGCWNSETWDRDKTLEIDNDSVVRKVLAGLNSSMPLNTLALLGGDPLFPSNIKDSIYILKKVKEVKPDLEVICWTGYTWEQVSRSKVLKEILPYIDILIDGRFIEELKVEGKRYGSSNQRCIDVKESLLKSEIILMEGF